MISPVNNVMQLGSVPETHQAEGKEVANVGRDLFVLKPLAFRSGNQEAHVNMIAEPK